MKSAMLPYSRYNRFSDFLRKKFGCRVYKISLDAGLGCPNRDGTVGSDGCLFCDPAGGSGSPHSRARISIPEQVRLGKEGLKKRYQAEKFIAYFQTYTNTYSSRDRLKRLYDLAVTDDDIVGLSIATRPDCLNPDCLELIQSYVPDYDTWVELGVQSMREKTLRSIQRGHGAQDTIRAVQALKLRDIQVCAHLILGLPGENLDDMAASLQAVSDLGVDAVKFHMLYVTRYSRLAEIYNQGELELMSEDEYVRCVVHLLERMHPRILVQRLVSEAHTDILVAPKWLKNKFAIIRNIEKTLETKKTFQGIALGNVPQHFLDKWR